ncbi:type I secretion system permease/ATPase [Devosia sp.]|uniref:type I secretion system permease/ATPase n=1 Tax=Devosia sp. TaxID=1871048 RepID=UPI0019E301F3|nr:type I secretion system permease/ATPase [Devosia sp.]MBE0579767.1 type I secretion system permease/ATPase [Devosia sp.]
MTRQVTTGRPAAVDIRRALLLPGTALVVTSLVSNLLMLAGPLFMLQIYDRVLASRSMPTLVALTVMICALYAYYAVLEAIRARMSMRAANIVDGALSGRLFAASVRFKLIPGALGNVDPVREGDTLRQFVSGNGPLALLDLPWMPIYLTIVFLMHPLLGWLALGGAVAIVALAIANELSSRGPAQKASSAQGARQRYIDDARSNAEAIVGMGMMADIERRRAVLNRDVLAAQLLAGDRTSAFSAIIKALRFLLQSAVLAVGAYLVIQGDLTGGLMIAASVITSRALAPVDQIVGQWRGFIAARLAYDRIRKILPKDNDGARETRLPLPGQKLSANQLAIGPRGAKVALVNGISFELVAGDALGIIGASGSGKSSLVRGLVGAWPTLSGALRLDGALLAHYDPSQIGGIVGYLPQQVDLFEGTVAENIARFRHDMTAEAVIAAARSADVHDMINSLPNGYDTPIGEQGDLLSAGQRQRIGLARALYGDPFLIVLDEPNSNLDAEGDAAVSKAIASARARGGIVVVVAHRPSAIASVDQLLLLQKGRQVSFGPKKDVLDHIAKAASGENVRPMKVSGQ